MCQDCFSALLLHFCLLARFGGYFRVQQGRVSLRYFNKNENGKKAADPEGPARCRFKIVNWEGNYNVTDTHIIDKKNSYISSLLIKYLEKVKLYRTFPFRQ